MSAKQQAIDLLEFARGAGLMLLKDYPESKYTWQVSPADNHPAWVFGHLACTDAWIGGLAGISGMTAPENWGPLFGAKSKPVSDASAYPPVKELREALDGNRAALLGWLRGVDEAELSKSIKEQTGGFATDLHDAMLKVAWHEGWHFGQVATLRKALGLPPVM